MAKMYKLKSYLLTVAMIIPQTNFLFYIKQLNKIYSKRKKQFQKTKYNRIQNETQWNLKRNTKDFKRIHKEFQNNMSQRCHKEFQNNIDKLEM